MFHIYIEPRAGTAPILQLIDQAKSQIDLNAYYIDALRQAVKRGVRVRVILEAHPYMMSAFRIRREFRAVQATGARFRIAPARFSLDHAKYVCSLKTCEIGTANFSWDAFHRNREYMVFTDDPHIVKAARQVFEADWMHTRAGQGPRKYIVLSPGATPVLVAAIRQPGPVHIEEEERGDDQPILRALESKGRLAQVILPQSAARHECREIATLRSYGVRIKFTPRITYMHTKMIVGRMAAFVGSQNFSWYSLNKNREMGLLFNNSSALPVLKSQFARDWQAASSQ